MEIDPISPKQASDLLRAHGLRAQKRLGQNFLIDRNTLDRIVRATDLQPDDPTVEIGPGLGALTLALADRSSSVTAVEIDRHLEPILTEVTSGHPNIHLIFADFLRLDLDTLFDAAFGDRPGVLVANIPYYITTPILDLLLTHKSRLRRIVLLVQLEFAQRMVAAPATEDYGAMSVYVQYHAQVEMVGAVPRTVFLPAPEVSSAIVALTPLIPGAVPVRSEERFSHIVRAAFGQRRKTLLNALLRAPASFGLGLTLDDREKAEAVLALAGIDGNRRGETLSLSEFARLADASLELLPVP
jgi:16S rRNA (adenine1518-N6/adenine1519-N6)-dimethyltransferase